jgi:hypothetical protein
MAKFTTISDFHLLAGPVPGSKSLIGFLVLPDILMEVISGLIGAGSRLVSAENLRVFGVGKVM